MKKWILLLMSVLTIAALAGCSEDTTPTGSPEGQGSSQTPSTPSVSSTPPVSSEGENGKDGQDGQEGQSGQVKEKEIVVADAALYRGTISAVTEGESGKQIRLTQAEGTNFGAPALTFLVDEDTRLSFEEGLLKEGAYVGVYYGMAPGQKLNPDELYTAIAINRYFDEEMVNFNGTLLSIKESDTKENAGVLEMQELGNEGNTVLFHYSPEHTQFYLNFKELEPGDVLNIFHRGTFTMSIPPQGNALEVRPYAAPENLN